MKKLIYILLLAIFITNCDDGDLKLESFNFDNQTVLKCTNEDFLFKVNSEELLLITVPVENFPNTVTPINEPRVVNIGATGVSAIYRKYSGAISQSFMCAAVSPATPTVSEQWTANGGTIEITTTEKLDATSTLVGYNHSIVFKNINFAGNNNSFSFLSYTFGTYETAL